MIFHFFDASSAVKRYCDEIGAGQVIAICDAPDNGIVISNLTYTEVLSALNRKKQDGLISQPEFDDAISRFFFDYQNKYLIMAMTDEIRVAAGKLILRHNLRSADSIQLATALEHKKAIGQFVCADDKLCKAATSEGLVVFNPEKPQAPSASE
jgi:predicted nucleic acid-binding protein